MRLRHAEITKGILAGFIFSGLLFITAQAADLIPFTDISPAQAAAIMKEKGSTSLFVLLDVRTAEEFAESRLAGALNLDVRGDDFKAKVEKLNREGAYLVYCRGGVRSARAMGLMKEWGFKQVYNLEGGLMNWQREKLPLESGPVKK
jgi:rhodanese-related sulfurtransferase